MSAPPPTAGSGGDAAPAPTSITVTDRTALTQAWWSYTRPEKYTVVTSKVKVPARDGVELGCTLSRPAMSGAAAAGKFPGLVVEFTPYALQSDSYNTEAAYFVKRGYNALVCTLRGVGESGGTWQNAFSPQDARDAHDLVEWLAVQEFSDGRIGQLGESYGGQTSYGSAIEAAQHLRAVAPMQPPANLYDDVIYPGGIPAIPNGTLNSWPPIGELLSGGKINAQAEYAVGDAHPTFDAFWQERSFVGRHKDIKVPVLTVGGWLDGYFRSGTMTNIEGALDKTWVFYGPWPHLPPVDMGTCAIACVEDPLPGGIILAWFDHWVMELKDVPIPPKPTFVSYENPKGGGRGWRELSSWLPEGPAAVTYELGSDRTLASSAMATEPMMFHEPGEPTANGAALSFTTAALTEDAVLLGRAVLEFRAKLSAQDANFYVEVIDVNSSGQETFVNDGYLRASHRASHEKPEPVPMGEMLDYRIVIRPQHHRFVAGHKLKLRISGGSKDMLEQPPAVDVTIETGKTAKLKLPGFAAKL